MFWFFFLTIFCYKKENTFLPNWKFNRCHIMWCTFECRWIKRKWLILSINVIHCSIRFCLTFVTSMHTVTKWPFLNTKSIIYRFSKEKKTKSHTYTHMIEKTISKSYPKERILFKFRMSTIPSISQKFEFEFCVRKECDGRKRTLNNLIVITQIANGQ